MARSESGSAQEQSQDTKASSKARKKDGDDNEKTKFWTTGKSTALKAALMVFIIGDGLPKNLRWVFFALMISSGRSFAHKIYAIFWVGVLALWYWPFIHPTQVYGILRSIDLFLRDVTPSIYQERVFSTITFIITMVLLRNFFDISTLTESLEMQFGPSEKWLRALWPALPCLLIIHDDGSVNGFVPEGWDGVWMGIVAKLGSLVVPFWIRWVVWLFMTTPDIRNGEGIWIVEWIFCYIAWAISDIEPHVAYAIYILVHQFPHAEFALRHRGGAPSDILLQQRKGTISFVATIFFIEAVAGEMQDSIATRIFSFSISSTYWLPVLQILLVAALFLSYVSPSSKARFEYKPLTGEKPIRLLRLRPQISIHQNSTVRCDMIYANLKTPPRYLAVSHCWSQPHGAKEMILINGAPFIVSQNIFSLLMAKRDPSQHVYLWIDSICINQEDDQEKALQVGMMRQIFQEAYSTICWLGDEPDSRKMLNFITRLNGVTEVEQFAALKGDKNSGWDEFRNLLCSPWFERTWIVQEVAVSNDPVIRCRGGLEIPWRLLTDAMEKVQTMLLHSGVHEELLQNKMLLNAIILQTIRLQEYDSGPLKLRDMLKVALRFKATLPVDKVFAFLGIIDERYSPLFRPKFTTKEDSKSTGEISDKGEIFSQVVEDFAESLGSIADLLSAAKGLEPSRRGRLLLDSRGDRGGLRLLKNLMRDFTLIQRKMERIVKGKGWEYELMRPDYSPNTTPEMVYTYVAKDLVRQGELPSFIRLAGVAQRRHSNLLRSLPSWVVDWSANPETYLLPYDRPKANDPVQAEEDLHTEEANDAEKKADRKETPTNDPDRGGNDDLTVRLGDLDSLHIKAAVLGTVAHLSQLSVPVESSKLDATRQAKKDMAIRKRNYKAAMALCQKYGHSCYTSGGFALDDAFFRTTLANRTHDGITPATDDDIARQRRWIELPEGLSASALSDFSPQTPPPSGPQSEEEDDKKSHEVGNVEDMISLYLSVRKMQCSANSIFAHMVRVDIMPSYATYRATEEEKSRYSGSKSKETKTEDKPGNGDQQATKPVPKSKQTGISIFGDTDSNITAIYGPFVDYTLGRKFAVTECGHFALVPDASREGDVIVWVKEWSLCLTLRKSSVAEEWEEDEEEEKGDGVEAASQKPQGDGLDPQEKRADGSYRLVGESFIYLPDDCFPSQPEDMWFVLW